MFHINAAVKITGGEFRTLMELIHAAIDARTYIAPNGGAADLAEKAKQKQRYVSSAAVNVFINPAGAGDLYMMDVFKGVRNGIATQATWLAADFTNQPGGGELLGAGKVYPTHRVELGGVIFFNAVDSIFFVDVSLIY